MANRSTIETLPQALFDEINRALNEGMTIERVVEHMKTLGADLSKSAVGRHKKKIGEVAEQIRKSRMIAEAVGRELGDKPDDKMAALNIELMHDQVMRLVTAGEDPEAPALTAKEARELADALYRLAAARKLDAERVLKVRKETAEKAVKALDTIAKKEGWSKETVANINRTVLGVAA